MTDDELQAIKDRINNCSPTTRVHLLHKLFAEIDRLRREIELCSGSCRLAPFVPPQSRMTQEERDHTVRVRCKDAGPLKPLPYPLEG